VERHGSEGTKLTGCGAWPFREFDEIGNVVFEDNRPPIHVARSMKHLLRVRGAQRVGKMSFWLIKKACFVGVGLRPPNTWKAGKWSAAAALAPDLKSHAALCLAHWMSGPAVGLIALSAANA
jgi:hypothetical protein